MDFGHPDQCKEVVEQEDSQDSISLKYEIPPPPVLAVQSLTSSAINGEATAPVATAAAAAAEAPSSRSETATTVSGEPGSLLTSTQTVAAAAASQRMIYHPSGAQALALASAKEGSASVGDDNYFGPKKKRLNSTEESVSNSEGTECGQTVGVYSELPSVLSGEPIYPRKGHAGLRKSTDTRKNNNRVALRDFTCGRRCVTDVKPIVPPMIVRLKVVNGISTERVMRKNKKTVLLDVGQRFGVLQLFVEGHPAPEEKVWVVTERGLAPIPSTAVERAMGQLTIDVREFPVIARGRVRRDPQKQGTRPKAGEPIIECFAIFAGDQGRPLWIDSSLITPEPAPVVVPSSQVTMDPSQIQLSPAELNQSSQQVPSADPSTIQHEDSSSKSQQQ